MTKTLVAFVRAMAQHVRQMIFRQMIFRYIHRLIATFILALLLAFAPAVYPSQSALTKTVERQEPSDPQRITRPTSKPYTGDLSIFEDPERDERLQINRVMEILKIKQGSNVADIGAGSGWFTVRAARRVGITGNVYAVEINREFLEHIEARAGKEKLSNIHTVLGKEDDPLLPRESLDAALILKTYHEVAQPILLLSHLRESMRAGALLGIIDKDGNGRNHGINREMVIKEAAKAGFSLVDQYDFVKPDGMDYFLVLRVGLAATSH